MENPDIVVVGGGIAGGAMATTLARAGLAVLMIEITKEHRDVVRGELLTQWGVAEAQRLGLYDIYRETGANTISRLVVCEENVPVEEAISGAPPISQIVPGIGGFMALGHPKACTALNSAAVEAGARFLRGVRHVRVTAGARPVVSFEHEGETYELRPRLVIGADGRHGQTRKQAGIPLNEDPFHHLNAGLLVAGIEDWPQDLGCLATGARNTAFIFPQGDGVARTYICIPEKDRGMIMGEEGPGNFLKALQLPCIPGSEVFEDARPAGEIFAYPNNDTWTDEPFTDGVVLVGDVAGHNDPIIGQGLSIAHRDVRIVSDILKSSDDWSPRAFAPYAAERAERMRRLRIVARMVATRDAEFGEGPSERRKRAHKNLAERPELNNFMATLFVGPDVMPPETYSDATVAAVRGDS